MMNPRIKELALQAKQYAHDNEDKYYERTSWDFLFETKFAELILKDCISCSNWVGTVNQHPIEPVHTARAINKRIKQHFGVTDENL